jgi:hypothetical protein
MNTTMNTILEDLSSAPLMSLTITRNKLIDARFNESRGTLMHSMMANCIDLIDAEITKRQERPSLKSIVQPIDPKDF